MFADYPSAESSWHPAVEAYVELDPGTEPVWVVVRLDRTAVAGLLYDPSLFNASGLYRLEGTTQAVVFERCHSDTFTQYHGGIVVDRPACVSLWIYEGSLTGDATVLHLGVHTECA